MNRRLEAALLAALLLFCVSCARLPQNVIPLPAPGHGTDAADYVTHINSSYEWEHTQWYRIGDPVETVGFFVVAMSGSICLSTDGMWAIIQHGELYHCADGWRSRSNSLGSTGSHVTR